MAGFQRQNHIDDTGWIGTPTYNSLVYSLIPSGLPHAGERGFDSTAIEMLNEAWMLFQGHEPTDGQGTVREAALALAEQELGYHETGNNDNKYGRWYGMNYQPWCAMFCTWAYETNERSGSPSFQKGDRYSYVPYIVGDARASRNGLKTTDDPLPGDMVCYDWSWDGTYDHVGLFEKWTGGTTFKAIEGNTSTSNNSNGGEVMRRDRNRSQQGTVFVRVAEP